MTGHRPPLYVLGCWFAFSFFDVLISVRMCAID